MSRLRMFIAILITACSFVVIGVLVWLFTTSKPILYSYRDSASASMGPTFVIFNPFRDKNPEVPAEQMLNLIKNGECKRAIADFPSDYSSICEKEAIYKLVDWSLADRKDFGDTSKLLYRTIREGEAGDKGIIFVEVKKTGDTWRLDTADFIY